MSLSVPEDFDEFWREAREEAASVRLDYHRRASTDILPDTGLITEVIKFESVGRRVLEGWISFPEGARRLPSFLWIPPYGRESLLPNAYGTREGFASMSFNFFGHSAFHQEKYIPERGYFAEGALHPETWIFRQMVQDCLIAARVLQAQLEADEDRIGAMGLSQGGGLAIASGAHSPVIRAVCADLPFLGNMTETLAKPVYRYPLKELVDFMESQTLGRERVLNTISYFDTVHQATRCSVPTHVSLGLKDPACRPDAVTAIYEALPGQKQLEILDWGHDWHPSMIENNRRWLLKYL